MLKCLWNICLKSDNLWVKWIYSYYLKGSDVMASNIRINSSWIMKNILSRRNLINQVHQLWDDSLLKKKFSMMAVYKVFIDDQVRVSWSHLLRHNGALPRAILTLWLAFCGHLATKARLLKMGMLQTSQCQLCIDKEENIYHLLFECSCSNIIWSDVLHWMEYYHIPQLWYDELNWIMRHTKCKDWKGRLLMIDIAEMIYGIWQHRNNVCFANNMDSTHVTSNIIDNIVYRGWMQPKLRIHISHMLM
ncbi:unnamed protein product [Lathyrus sativus]|nr:unnamed protein product [Lathyrus sativus]